MTSSKKLKEWFLNGSGIFTPTPSWPLLLNNVYVCSNEMVIWLTPPPQLSTWFMDAPFANHNNDNHGCLVVSPSQNRDFNNFYGERNLKSLNVSSAQWSIIMNELECWVRSCANFGNFLAKNIQFFKIYFKDAKNHRNKNYIDFRKKIVDSFSLTPQRSNWNFLKKDFFQFL